MRSIEMRIAEAASDYKMALKNDGFADEFGGRGKLLSDLFRLVDLWENGHSIPLSVNKKDFSRDVVGRKTKYPIKEMMVGDSFVADGFKASGDGCRAYNSAKGFERRYGWKFTGKKVGQNEIRITRVL